MMSEKHIWLPFIFDSYWCQYAEGGACWVFRWFEQEMWYGTGKTRWRAFLNSLGFYQPKEAPKDKLKGEK